MCNGSRMICGRDNPMNDLSTYHKIRPSIRSGDIIEWGANSVLGRAIRSVTKKDVNHSSACIWLRPEIAEHLSMRNLSIPRLYILESIENGTRLTFLSSKLKEFNGVAYISQLKAEYDSKRNRFAHELLKNESVPYDWTSLIRNLWRRVPIDPERMYCSEQIHWAAIQSGLLESNYSPDGKPEHKRCGIVPGEFGATGLFYNPIRII
jgi:hypothetical protein